MISPDPDHPPGFRNVVNGAAKTWPYGTRKVVKVAEACIPAEKAFEVTSAEIRPEFRGTTVFIVTEVHDPTVGHLLLNCDHLVQPVKGCCYIMEFTKGGPMGGYWRLISEAIPA